MSRGREREPGQIGEPCLERLLPAAEEGRHELREVVRAERAQTTRGIEFLQERARGARQPAAQLQNGGPGVRQPLRHARWPRRGCSRHRGRWHWRSSRSTGGIGPARTGPPPPRPHPGGTARSPAPPSPRGYTRAATRDRARPVPRGWGRDRGREAARSSGASGCPRRRVLASRKPSRGELPEDPVERDQGLSRIEARAGRDVRRAARLSRGRLQSRALEDAERQPVDELIVEVPGAEERAAE